jgi:hypothetical protein
MKQLGLRAFCLSGPSDASPILFYIMSKFRVKFASISFVGAPFLYLGDVKIGYFYIYIIHAGKRIADTNGDDCFLLVPWRPRKKRAWFGLTWILSLNPAAVLRAPSRPRYRPPS